MATCPGCHEFLSDFHHCTKGKRRRVRRIAGIVTIGCASAGVALLLSSSALWGVSAAVLGGMATSAVWRE